jgi:endogenous inhibitor of DNA gyrase (YacG/DUF329 family)
LDVIIRFPPNPLPFCSKKCRDELIAHSGQIPLISSKHHKPNFIPTIPPS